MVTDYLTCSPTKTTTLSLAAATTYGAGGAGGRGGGDSGGTIQQIAKGYHSGGSGGGRIANGDGVSQPELNSKSNNLKLFNSNNTNTNNTMTHHQPTSQGHHQSASGNNHHTNNNNHINSNMVPIISVTPHSPGSKHNNLLGECYCGVCAYVLQCQHVPINKDFRIKSNM